MLKEKGTTEVESNIPPPPSEEPPLNNLDEGIKPEPVRTKPIVLNPSTSGKPKETPSIFGRKKEKVEVPEEDIEPTVIDKKETEFSDEELQKAWKAFADQRAGAGDTDKLVLSKSVKKGENHSVIITLGSQLEVSFLEKFDTELVQFLRSELKNDHVVLRREIEEIEETKKLYTSKDIFDEMVKQNPDLKDLKDRLGLDFDY